MALIWRVRPWFERGENGITSIFNITCSQPFTIALDIWGSTKTLAFSVFFHWGKDPGYHQLLIFDMAWSSKCNKNEANMHEIQYCMSANDSNIQTKEHSWARHSANSHHISIFEKVILWNIHFGWLTSSGFHHAGMIDASSPKWPWKRSQSA